MKSKTHKRITKIILPDVDPRTIDRVNKKIDKPEAWVPISPEFARVPWVSYRGHRIRAHDPISAMAIDFKEGGKQGVRVAGSTFDAGSWSRPDCQEIRRRVG